MSLKHIDSPSILFPNAWRSEQEFRRPRGRNELVRMRFASSTTSIKVPFQEDTSMRVVTHTISACILCLVISVGAIKAQQKLKIAVIPKGDDSFFWQAARAGAESCGETIGGVDVVWKAPKVAQDVQQQIAVVDQFVQSGVSGIAISPTDHTALAPSVARAMKKGIPVVVFDSDLDGKPGKDYVGFVGTDSRNGGKLAGEEMAKLIGGKGKVVVLRYTVGQANITEREEGFIKALEKNKDIQIVTKKRNSKTTVDDAQAAGESMIEELKTAAGIFCPNEMTTEGMLRALRGAGLTTKIKFVGFDTSELLLEGLKKGEIDALMAQDPTRMGYFAVKSIVDHIRGASVPPVTDTGVRVVTKENINDPEIQKLIALPTLVK